MDILYEVVYWDYPGFGSCIRRDKEPLVVGENPTPIRVGTVLRCEKALGVVLPHRKTQDGTDIHGHSVAVQILYSVLREKYKMSKDMKYEVWSLDCSEIMKGEMATAAKDEPKMFITALLEAEVKIEEEERRKNPFRPLPSIPKEEKPVGRTAVKRTPVVAKTESTQANLPVARTPVQRTPVLRTPVKVEFDPIAAMKEKLSRI